MLKTWTLDDGSSLVPRYRTTLLLILKRSEITFIVTRRWDEEQQKVCSLLRSPPEPKGRCPSTQCREDHAVDGLTDTGDTEGCSVCEGGPPKSREVESLVQELLGHHQEDEKGDGS